MARRWTCPPADSTSPHAHSAASDYVSAVANALTARGFQVTHDIRQGLLRFELPAALRPGDLIVTTIESEPFAGPRRNDSAADLVHAGEGMVVIMVGPNDHAASPQLAAGRPISRNANLSSCRSVTRPPWSVLHLSRR